MADETEQQQGPSLKVTDGCFRKRYCWSLLLRRGSIVLFYPISRKYKFRSRNKLHMFIAAAGSFLHNIVSDEISAKNGEQNRRIIYETDKNMCVDH